MRTRDQKAQCGFSAWLQNHIARRSIDPDAMQRSVDNFMRKYDQRVREQEKQKELESTTVDSEGWTKVTRRGGRLARVRNLRSLSPPPTRTYREMLCISSGNPKSN